MTTAGPSHPLGDNTFHPDSADGPTVHVLIAFASRRGGTAGLADMIGDELREAGCETVVSPADGIYELAGFDAVIIAGALYANRWPRAARRFVRHYTTQLRALPTWLVSSGPLDDSALRTDIPPTAQVADLARRIGARGHVTFGGRLAAHPRGLLARSMAKTRAGDWRDRAHVRRWVHSVLVDLGAATDHHGHRGMV